MTALSELGAAGGKAPVPAMAAPPTLSDALKTDPHNSRALLLEMATEARKKGRFDIAVACLQLSLDVRPDDFEAHFLLGNNLWSLDRLDEAEASFRRALAIAPHLPEPKVNIGSLMKNAGRLDEARAILGEVMRSHPGFTLASVHLADVCCQLGDYGEAIRLLRRIANGSPAARLNLANALVAAGMPDEAIGECMVALPALPAEAHFRIAAAHSAAGRLDAAIEHYGRALDLGHGGAEWQLAVTCLCDGRMARGWKHYECRLGSLVPIPDLDCPQWHGQPLEGKRLLVVGEQGRGDEIQFFRYVPALAERGAVVDITTFAESVPLFRTLRGVNQVMPAVPSCKGAYDYWLPMMSAPLRLGVPDDAGADRVPYLSAPPEKAAYWKTVVAGMAAGRRRIGLCWAGSRRNPKPGRAVPFDLLEPLLATAGIQFFGLVREQPVLPAYETHANLLSLGAHLEDFGDTAAVVANLDLVITVDTAVAHLAGAMGVPAWTLLQAAGDWRWRRQDATTAWYPSMRLFRQKTPGAWSDTIAEAAGALRAMQRPDR
jgi:tetratricopeptide (TPR) repeat protein